MIYARIANNMKRDKLFDEENFESIYLTGKNNLEYNMAISNKTWYEVDLVIREYETKYYSEIDGNPIKEPKETMKKETKWNAYSLIGAVKLLIEFLEKY